MPAGYTEVDVANLALGHLGQSATLTALTDDRDAARVAARELIVARDLELYNFVWPFAVKRATLTVMAVPAGYSSDYQSAYDLTAITDLLRVLEPTQGEDYSRSIGWRIENNVLLTFLSPADYTVRYIAQITDPAEWSMHFLNVCSFRLAMRMSETLKGSNTSLQILSQRYEQAVQDARRYESLASHSPVPPNVHDAWDAPRTEALY